MVVPTRFLSSKPILLVDGSNLLIRLSYARQKGSNLLTQHELVTSVAEMFIHHMSEIVKKNNCSDIVVAFDNGSSMRKKSIYPEYKANRIISSCPAALSDEASKSMREMYPVLREAVVALCRAFELAVFCEYGIEADDIIGILAEKYNEAGRDCIVLSNDTDFLQLCSMPKVVCMIPYKKVCIDMHTFPEYFSSFSKKMDGVKIHAKEYIFYKSLVGDSGDNIVGIKGIGYKTLHKKKEEYLTKYPAMALILEENQLEFITEVAKEPNKDPFEKIIASNIDTIIRNYKLIDISSKYASSNLTMMAYQLLRRAPSIAPDKKKLIQICSTILPSTLALQPILEACSNLGTVYVKRT